MTLTNSQRELYGLFAKFDKNGCGRLDFSEFLGFMIEGLDVPPNVDFLKQIKFLFNGIESNETVGPEEASNCVLAWKHGNHEKISKLIFCGADTKNRGKVSIDELSYGSRYLGRNLNRGQFLQECKIVFPNKKQLEFHEFYQIITGVPIERGSGESNSSQQSSCCLLI